MFYGLLLNTKLRWILVMAHLMCTDSSVEQGLMKIVMPYFHADGYKKFGGTRRPHLECEERWHVCIKFYWLLEF